MSINIQHNGKLVRFSTHQHTNKEILDILTNSKIEEWDNKSEFSGDYNDLTNKPDIVDDGSNQLLIVDDNGNIIFKVDEEGAHSINMTVNGMDVATQEFVNEKVADVHSHDNKDVLDSITSEDVLKWDNKSEFSGDYNDLTNKPDIVDDGSNQLLIVDDNGNIIFKVDEEGAHSINMTVNGMDVATQEFVNEKLKDIQSLSELVTDLNYNNLLEFDTSRIVFDSTVNVAATARLDEGVLDKLILDSDGSSDGVNMLNNIRSFSTEYGKQNFEPGQVLKAEHLNHMEDGIYANAESLSVLGLSTVTVNVDDSGVVNVPVTGIELDLYSYNAKVGGGFYINPIVLPTDATNRNVLWSSSETSLATVDQYGYVSCIGEGDVIITCTTEEGGFVATCNVNIEKAEEGGEDPGETIIAVTSISLNQSSLTLEVGQTSQLTATVLPADATNKNIVWSSTDTAKATVSNGKVTAVAEGTATIIVRSESNPSVTATCAITVKAVEVEEPETPPVVEGKVQLSTLEKISGGIKADGGTHTLGGVYHVIVPYTEGMIVNTLWNSGWSTSTYPPILVEYNGTYTIPSYTKGDSIISIGGKLPYSYTATITGYYSGAKVIINMLVNTGTNSDMDETDSLYYIAGETPAEDGGSGSEGGENPDETIAVTSIALNKNSLTLEVGQTSQLTATVSPTDATNKNIVWSSTDTTKATVVNGEVTAIAEGTATIIARSESNSNITATCNLTVEAEEVIVPEEPMEGQYFLYDLTPEGSGLLLNKNGTSTFSNIDANYYKLSYTEGMTIVTGMNNSWTPTYPPVIVKDNETITIPTFAASGTKIHGGLADKYEITLTGFSADAIVYVNSYRLMTYTTNRSDSYYIEGTEVEGGSGGTENPDVPIEGKLQLSTLERTAGYVKSDGTVGSLGGAYYVTIPYTEGMIVNSVWKSSWEESTNYCILVKYNGTYTPINVEYSSTFVSVGDVSLCNTCSATITGFYEGAEVIVNMVIGSSTSDQMDEYDYFYYMEGETPATDPGTGGGDSGETGDPNTPVKVQLSTFERTAGGFKNDGSTHALSGTYYVEVPYVEGMVVRTLWNTGWNMNTYCPVLIKTLDSFTPTVAADYIIGTTQSIGGKVPTQHEIKLTGFTPGSTVIIQMLIGSATNQKMDESDYLYYMIGGNE